MRVPPVDDLIRLPGQESIQQSAPRESVALDRIARHEAANVPDRSVMPLVHLERDRVAFIVRVGHERCEHLRRAAVDFVPRLDDSRLLVPVVIQRKRRRRLVLRLERRRGVLAHSLFNERLILGRRGALTFGTLLVAARSGFGRSRPCQWFRRWFLGRRHVSVVAGRDRQSEHDNRPSAPAFGGSLTWLTRWRDWPAVHVDGFFLSLCP